MCEYLKFELYDFMSVDTIIDELSKLNGHHLILCHKKWNLFFPKNIFNIIKTCKIKNPNYIDGINTDPIEYFDVIHEDEHISSDSYCIIEPASDWDPLTNGLKMLNCTFDKEKDRNPASANAVYCEQRSIPLKWKYGEKSDNNIWFHIPAYMSITDNFKRQLKELSQYDQKWIIKFSKLIKQYFLVRGRVSVNNPWTINGVCENENKLNDAAISINEYYKYINDIHNTDEVVISDNKIKIIFDYPLRKLYTFDFESENGFTRISLIAAICDTYKSICDTYKSIYSTQASYDIPEVKCSCITHEPVYITPHINDMCIICRDKYIDNTIAVKLSCDHIFHKSCIDTWFIYCYNRKCPICMCVKCANNVNDKKMDSWNRDITYLKLIKLYYDYNKTILTMQIQHKYHI